MIKMLADKPGLIHLAKEGVLKQGEITDKLRQNQKYQNGTDVGNFLRRATGTIEHLALVAGSTLAQVAVNGTGTHFLKRILKRYIHTRRKNISRIVRRINIQFRRSKSSDVRSKLSIKTTNN